MSDYLQPSWLGKCDLILGLLDDRDTSSPIHVVSQGFTPFCLLTDWHWLTNMVQHAGVGAVDMHIVILLLW